MKRLFWLIIIFLCIAEVAFAENNYEIEQFKSSGAYDTFKIAEEYFEDFDSISIVEDFLKGKPFDEKGLLEKATDILFNQSKKTMKSVGFLLICGVIVAFISNTACSMSEKSSVTGDIAGYVIFASALLTFFCELIVPAKDSLSDITVMVKSLFSILITSSLLSGGVATAGLMQNIMFLSVTVITEIINKVLLPIILCSAVFSAAGNMSDKINISNIVKTLNSFVKWCISFLMIFFVGLFSIYGIAGSSVDACLGKTAKFILGSSVPIVGGILSDSLSTVLATVEAVRSITGNIGIIVIILIAIMPIIKTTIYVWSLKLCSGLLEPLSEKKIITLINDVTQSATMILVCLISVTLLSVAAVAILLMSVNMIG